MHSLPRAVFFDVDGTLTDGGIYLSSEGELFKRFNVKDDYALAVLLPKHHIIPIIITGRYSKIVEIRCNELGITHLYQAITDKLVKLQEVLNELDLNPSEVAYFGDDLIDLSCINYVGYSGCPNDAINEVKCAVDYVTSSKAGNAAAREFVEHLLNMCYNKV